VKYKAREYLMAQSILDRLIQGLDIAGVKAGRGRVKEVAEKTGYSEGMVSRILNGKNDPAEKFIIAVCAAFNINKYWVSTGGTPTFLCSGEFHSASAVLTTSPSEFDKPILNPNHITPSQLLRDKIQDAQIDLEKLIKILPGLADTNIQKALQSGVVREAILEIMKMPVPRRWEAVGMLKRMNEKDEEQS